MGKSGWLLWLLLSAGVWAQQPGLVIRTDPAREVIISDPLGQLGLSGETIHLRSAAPEVALLLQKPGWKSLQKNLVLASIGKDGFYPPLSQPPLQLEPDSAGAYLSRYGPKALCFLGLAGLVVWLATRPRVRVVEQAAPEGSGTLKPGKVLGRYRVLRLLGQGAMAWVYEVAPVDDGRAESRAMKVLQRSKEQGTDFEARFLREIRLSQKLVHPHIVQLYDFDVDYPYLVMELVPGGTLRDRIWPELPLPRVRQWLKELFEAVACAHQHGVVHRDLKPENILVNAQERIKVADFGLALHLDSQTITQSGTALGTPAYMAPEQIQGNRFDYASDQYALGVISFELLTGRRPFEDEKSMHVIFQHVSKPAPPPSSFRLELGPEVDEVVQRMLEKTSALRFESVAEAWLALDEALSSQC